jgi:anti-sigma B factor antagonist
MSPFDISISSRSGFAFVSIAGELDLATARDLDTCFAQLPPSSVVVDAVNLTFVDSSGLSCLIRARRALEASGFSLCVIRPRSNVRRAFEITGLEEMLAEDDPSSESVAN